MKAKARSLVFALLSMASIASTSLASHATAAVQASPVVNVEFALIGGGNQDRDLQYTPAEVGFRRAFVRFVTATAVPLMAPGQTLYVKFEEVTLAGSYESWRAPRADSVCFMTDAYPPRIALAFRWTDADGRVIRDGARLLTNLDYLRDPRAALSADALRYDKALLEAWLEKELSAR